MKKHKPMNFEQLESLFIYCPETGEIRNKVDRGVAGAMAKAGAITTTRGSDGYLVVRFMKNSRRVTYKAHRVAWLLHTGDDPGEKEIDHLNRIKDDNRFCNLELVTRVEHTKRHPKRSDNTSGITGVSWEKKAGKWLVQISDRGERQRLGCFLDKFEAICCRKSAERRLGYHENHGK